MKYILLLLAIISASFVPAGKLFAHLEKAFYLKGKAGAEEIAVKMLSYDETPAVRNIQYFFLHDKRDRYMTGKLVDDSWQFSAVAQDTKSYPVSEGTLNIAANGTNWQGSWTDNRGEKQPVVLTPIPADFIPPQYSHLPLMQQMDPYERYRFSTLRFVETITGLYSDGVKSDWYIEKESGIAFFRLKAYNNDLNTGNINAALEAIHLSLVQKYFAYSPQKNYALPETQLLYLTNELVSFRTVSTSRFLNLTTSQVQLAATLDVANGKKLNPEDLIWFGKTIDKPQAGDFFALFQYRKKVFAPKVFQLLQRLYPEKMKPEHCGINKAESWNLPAWNLTTKGLALGINATDECGTFKWAIIPYESLKPFMEKKYHLLSGK